MHDWRIDARAWLRSLFPASSELRIDVRRERPWGTNWRVVVDDGVFWFKRGHPSLWHEAALLEVLKTWAPEHVLVPAAVKRRTGWILTPDQGPTLAEAPAGEAPQNYIGTAVSLAATQRALAKSVGELDAVGLPRCDPAHAVALLDESLAWLGTLPSSNPSRISIGTRRAATAEAATLVNRWVAVASPQHHLGLDHNDLHLGNVFRGPLISDWGDAVMGHPFASMRALVIGARNDVGTEFASRLRSTYLAHWGDPDDLQETLELAMQLASVQRLYAWRRLASPELVAEYAHHVLPLVEELGQPVNDLSRA